MKRFWFLVKEVATGKSMVRSFLNYRLMQETLDGKILDLGSGGSDRYSERIPKSDNAKYILFDVKKGESIDFESDALPYADGAYDTVLLLNVLEHIYNHKHLLSEVKRIKKEQGALIGFVPFLMWYHADPHDYFRYTHESLEKILKEVGYQDVTIENIHFGPYITAFQMVHPTIPKVLRPFFFSPLYVIDLLFRKVRRKSAERYALGYYFKAQ